MKPTHPPTQNQILIGWQLKDLGRLNCILRYQCSFLLYKCNFWSSWFRFKNSGAFSKNLIGDICHHFCHQFFVTKIFFQSVSFWKLWQVKNFCCDWSWKCCNDCCINVINGKTRKKKINALWIWNYDFLVSQFPE